MEEQPTARASEPGEASSPLGADVRERERSSEAGAAVPGVAREARLPEEAEPAAPEGERPRRIEYTPAVPDGPDCPWTRERGTRWWLVLPADAVSVGLASLFASAGLRAFDSTTALAGVGAPAWVFALLVTWFAASRGRRAHLEMAVPEGLGIAGGTWLLWLAGVAVLPGMPELSLASLSPMLAVFLGLTMVLWRWLYGFAKAQESLTPKPLAKRIAAQEAEDQPF